MKERSRGWVQLLIVVLSFTTLGSVARPLLAESAVRLEIDKADRVLRLFVDDELEQSFPVGLGFAPIGTKVEEGDGATPEGTYSVCVKNPKSKYSVSLGLDYPNIEDADRGLRAGRISRRTHRQISEALAAGNCPPWNSALGGEIFIHGSGSGRDWTLGCVALDDRPMKLLFDVVAVGTPVIIRP